MNNMEVSKKIKTVSNLNLTLAIVSTIMAIPVLGYFLDFMFAIPSIAVLIISIVGLVMSAKVKDYAKRTGFILSLIAAALGIIAVIAAYNFAIGSDLLDTAGSMDPDALDAGGAVIFLVFSIAAWGLYIAACVVNYMNFSKNKKMATLAMDEGIAMDEQNVMFE